MDIYQYKIWLVSNYRSNIHEHLLYLAPRLDNTSECLHEAEREHMLAPMS